MRCSLCITPQKYSHRKIILDKFHSACYDRWYPNKLSRIYFSNFIFPGSYIVSTAGHAGFGQQSKPEKSLYPPLIGENEDHRVRTWQITAEGLLLVMSFFVCFGCAFWQWNTWRCLAGQTSILWKKHEKVEVYFYVCRYSFPNHTAAFEFDDACSPA